MADIEVIDLNLDSIPFSGSSSGGRPSVNFGGGIELLMNDKHKNSEGRKSPTMDIDLGDLNDLEAELNNLSEPAFDVPAQSKSGLFGGNSLFSSGFKLNTDPKEDKDNVSIGSIVSVNDPMVGKATASSAKGDG